MGRMAALFRICLRWAVCPVSILSITGILSCTAARVPADKAALLATPSPSPAPVHGRIYHETGIASWYGKEFHGRKTANGETFDMYGLSAAHRTLPLGAEIRVTNLENNKSIKVRVNDRGPYAKSRVLDLSYAAAKELGFVAQGTARVRIESLDEVREPGRFTVQAGSFIEEENARALKERLSRRYEFVYIVQFETNIGRFYRVRVGSYPTEEKAGLVASRLAQEGLEPIVMRKD